MKTISHIKKGLTGFSQPLNKPFGGADEDRTHDLLNAIQALSQLSYSPVSKLVNERGDLAYGFRVCQYIFLDISQPLI
jgi:hypothetical protein